MQQIIKKIPSYTNFDKMKFEQEFAPQISTKAHGEMIKMDKKSQTSISINILITLSKEL